MDELKLYTQNRNAAVAEAAREAEVHPGWLAARSLNGVRTCAVAPSMAELRELLAAANLSLTDVVIECIDDRSIDLDACRFSSES